jgi:4-amino-4-deoxy-L-arabinose transferase-like glycosyltransferase
LKDGSTMTAQRPRQQEFIVLRVGAVLRVLVTAVILLRYPHNWLYTRGMEMGLLAKSLVEGHGLSSPFGPPTGPTAFIAPGYPILVAGIFKLFGVYSFASVIAVLSLQIAVNVLTILLTMRVARELFGDTAAMVSGWIWACSLPLLWLPTIFWDTSLAICGVMGFLLLALHMRRHARTTLWIAMGAACGLLALLNPALLPMLAGIMAWTAWQSPPRCRSGALLAVITALVVFSPWPIRNARVFHAFVPLRTTVGFEMWMGNRPGATGYVDESIFPTFNADELAEYETMGEIAYTSHKSKLASDYILQHPAIFFELTLRRIFRFWTGTGTQNGSLLFVLHATAGSLLGLFGLFRLFRGHRISEAMLFLIPILLFPNPYYITHAEFRYRLVIDPEMAILAAFALVSIFSSQTQDVAGEEFAGHLPG